MIRDLILKNRSYRRFDQTHAIDEETLKELVDLARNSASASNRQPLKYILSCDPEKNAKIFPLLGFAGQLRDWPGPAEGERPTAYIMILLDTEIAKATGCDHGIASQNIMLGATEMGLGGCMLGSVKREKLKEILNIPEHLKIRLVLAIGKPKEEVILKPIGPDGSIRYWRDEKGVHYVPKRNLNDIIVDSYN